MTVSAAWHRLCSTVFMPADPSTPFATPGGEDPSALARELVSEAAADYTRVRQATIAGVAPAGSGAAAAAHNALRAAVVAYAKALCSIGAPAERAVVEVMSAVEAALPLDELERRACVGSAVRWAITAYNNA
jgi:hypothetical protein